MGLHTGCGCGLPRDAKVPDLQCYACTRWFHIGCLNVDVGTAVPFMTHYRFRCRGCVKAVKDAGSDSKAPAHLTSGDADAGAGSAEEVKDEFARYDASWMQIIVTAIANLHVKDNGGIFPPAKHYIQKTCIQDWIERNWSAVSSKAFPPSFRTKVSVVLTKADDVFEVKDETAKAEYMLVYHEYKSVFDIVPVENKGQAAGKTLGPKRKRDGDAGQSRRAKRQRGNGQDARVKQDTVEYPYNKHGYSYQLTEVDPQNSERFRLAFPDEKVLVSPNDLAEQLTASHGRLELTGHQGYCLARTNFPVSCGTWYFEATVLEHHPHRPGLPDGHCRIGWAQKYANLQGPCGFDCFGFAWRTLGGKFHESRVSSYADGETYGVGDTVGFMLHLEKHKMVATKHVEARKKHSARRKKQSATPSTDEGSDYELMHLVPKDKSRVLIDFRGNTYYEIKDAKAKVRTPPLKGSSIRFFKNGRDLGVAFEGEDTRARPRTALDVHRAQGVPAIGGDACAGLGGGADIPEGAYYPAVSLYMGGRVKLNFGPNFKHPPPSQYKWRPMEDAAMVEVARAAVDDLVTKICDPQDGVAP